MNLKRRHGDSGWETEQQTENGGKRNKRRKEKQGNLRGNDMEAPAEQKIARHLCEITTNRRLL